MQPTAQLGAFEGRVSPFKSQLPPLQELWIVLGQVLGVTMSGLPSTLRQAAEAKQLLKASSASNTGMKKANINEDFMQKHEQLREVVRATDELQSSVKAGHWDVEAR
eukprot:6201609-Pleurochrysis_carterae.AAC.1